MTDPIHVKVDSAGRLLVPAELREKFGIRPGGMVVLREKEGHLQIVNQRQLMREAQAYFRQFVPEGVSLVDELIAERRREAAKEESENS